jgi:hypothetical protein
MPAARTAMQQQERNNMKRMIELSLGVPVHVRGPAGAKSESIPFEAVRPK